MVYFFWAAKLPKTRSLKKNERPSSQPSSSKKKVSYVLLIFSVVLGLVSLGLMFYSYYLLIEFSQQFRNVAPPTLQEMMKFSSDPEVHKLLGVTIAMMVTAVISRILYAVFLFTNWGGISTTWKVIFILFYMILIFPFDAYYIVTLIKGKVG